MLSAQTPPLPVTLPEDLLPGLRDVLHRALQESPQMISHNLDLAAQEANRYQQAAQLWPSLSGNFNYAYNQSVLTSNANTNTRSSGLVFSVNLYQPIFHWGALEAVKDISHLQIKISERRYAEAYGQLATTLRSQYLSLIAQKVQLRNVRFSIGQTKTAVAVVEDRFKSGTATQDELTNAHLQLDEANLNLDRTVDGFAYSQHLFALTAGVPELSDAAVPDEIPKPVYAADTTAALLRNFVHDGLNNTFEVKIYDYQIRQSDLNYKIAKYRLYPRFDLALGVNEQNQTNATTSAISQTSVLSDYVALAASWNIFDGFATRGARLAALTSKRQAERDRTTYVDQTLAQAHEMERQLEFSARAMSIAEQRFGLSAQAWQRAKDDFKLHNLSQAEMDQATISFYQSQSAIFGARADFLSQWSGYLSLLGIDPVLNNLPASFTSNAK
ncbi:MAG TPA: TolC family protein [Opitutaceae bacterium]|jgi:outer membrane protein TolC|nr:TolC family protein [Opitutaceae bacterium]